MFKWKRKAIMAKPEGVYGTDSVPVAATDAMLGFDVELKPLSLELDKRDFVVPYFGGRGQLVAGQFATLNLSAEAAGSGAAGTAPKFGALFKGCALSETVNAGVSVVYAPVSTAEQSLTLYWYMDGILHKLLGARGDAGWDFSRGKKPRFTFEFIGLYAGPSDTALITPTLTGFQTPLPVNNVNTTPVSLHAYAAAFSSVAGKLGNVVQYRNLIGSEYVAFTDRESSGSCSMEAPTIATKDFFTIAKNGTLGALTLTHGTAAGNKVKLDCGQTQVVSADYAEESRVAMLNLGLDFQPSSAGNNEVQFTFL